MCAADGVSASDIGPGEIHEKNEEKLIEKQSALAVSQQKRRPLLCGVISTQCFVEALLCAARMGFVSESSGSFY